MSSGQPLNARVATRVVHARKNRECTAHSVTERPESTLFNVVSPGQLKFTSQSSDVADAPNALRAEP